MAQVEAQEPRLAEVIPALAPVAPAALAWPLLLAPLALPPLALAPLPTLQAGPALVWSALGLDPLPADLPERASIQALRAMAWAQGCGSKPMGSHFGEGAPPTLGFILVGIGMFTEGTGF